MREGERICVVIDDVVVLTFVVVIGEIVEDVGPD